MSLFHNPTQRCDVANLAAGLLEPSRAAEVARYHQAIIATLNETHTNGEQDALALLEAVALTLAQLTGNMPLDGRRGLLTYVVQRADDHAPEFRAAGIAARASEEPRGELSS